MNRSNSIPAAFGLTPSGFWFRSTGARFVYPSDMATVSDDVDNPHARSARPDDEPMLVFDDDAQRTSYDPMRDAPQLFLTFADLDGSVGSITRFATAYGPLGWIRPGSIEGESLADWQSQVRLMRLCVRLWDALMGKLPMSEVRCEIEMSKVSIASLQGLSVSSPVFDEAMGGDPNADGSRSRTVLTLVPVDATDRDVARAVLAEIIERACVIYEARFGMSDDGTSYGAGLRFSFFALRLIGMLWLQLALAIDGNRDYRRCPICGGWYDATGARSHKWVCGANCRARQSYLERTGQIEEHLRSTGRWDEYQRRKTAKASQTGGRS